MKINYFDCPHHYCEEMRMEDGIYEWVYFCDHPKGTGRCYLDNKYGGEKDDCKLLGGESFQKVSGTKND